MSNDPVIYDDKTRPNLCRPCVNKQNWAMLLTGYCMSARCDGCGRVTDLAMVKLDRPLKQDGRTGTQNRPYPPGSLMVQATFKWEAEEEGMGSRAYIPQEEILIFNWNNRDEVRNFASQSDRIIRMGGSTHVEQVQDWEKCPSCAGRCVEDAHAVGDGNGGLCKMCNGTGAITKPTTSKR